MSREIESLRLESLSRDTIAARLFTADISISFRRSEARGHDCPWRSEPTMSQRRLTVGSVLEFLLSAIARFNALVPRSTYVINARIPNIPQDVPRERIAIAIAIRWRDARSFPREIVTSVTYRYTHITRTGLRKYDSSRIACVHFSRERSPRRSLKFERSELRFTRGERACSCYLETCIMRLLVFPACRSHPRAV